MWNFWVALGSTIFSVSNHHPIHKPDTARFISLTQTSTEHLIQSRNIHQIVQKDNQGSHTREKRSLIISDLIALLLFLFLKHQVFSVLFRRLSIMYSLRSTISRFQGLKESIKNWVCIMICLCYPNKAASLPLFWKML